MPSTVIIIPTLRGGPPLEACLGALERQSHSDFEIVVVNNGGDLVQIHPPSWRVPVRVLKPGANLGFGAAVNAAIERSDAPFVATLNDDTVPGPDWLKQLVSSIETSPRLGMCASHVRLLNSNMMDSAGLLICLDGSSKQRGGKSLPPAFSEVADVLAPSACAAIYRREMLQEIGGFDGDFFLYCEDTDLGLRARWAGWDCRYVPSAMVAHRYSATSGAASPLKARFVERNRLWVAIKNFPAPLLAAVPLFAVGRYVCQFIAGMGGTGAASQYLREGNSIGHAIKVVLGAHIETIWQLPHLLRKRAAIRGTRRISSAQFVRLLLRHHIGLWDLARA